MRVSKPLNFVKSFVSFFWQARIEKIRGMKMWCLYLISLLLLWLASPAILLVIVAACVSPRWPGPTTTQQA